ncbi:MAG TPA: VOC family protein [Mycobacteriales bacterium]|nr:VOC family protein [Mycobacteriales bacterium]
MAQPVVHFEVIGRDAAKLTSYYSSLFGWEVNADNPMNYGMVAAAPTGQEGVGSIGGGIGSAPDGYDGHATFYVAVPDVEAALVRAEELGGSRMMGPEDVGPEMQIGLFNDPEGHLVGVVSGG